MATRVAVIAPGPIAPDAAGDLGPCVAAALAQLPSEGPELAGRGMEAAAVVARPTPVLLLAIAVWKMATEALYPMSGTPIWEFVERAGSYAAPLALALILIDARSTVLTLRRSSR